jgi:precorrin-6B methylase 1
LDQPSLIVVGTGIRIIGQMTIESIAWIKMSDEVLYLAPDPVAGEVIRGLNPRAESLARFYVEGKHRRESLGEMVARVMEYVRSGRRICLVCYGHPGVLCWVGHEAVRQARGAGYSAKMLPGISAEDCLFADLGLDPGTHGCQSFEATDYLKYGQKADPSSLVILWQIGVTGDPLFTAKGYKKSGLPLLIKRLCRIYGPKHEVIVYTAPIHWAAEPAVERVPLGQLGTASLSGSSTLCITPARASRPEMEGPKRAKRVRLGRTRN